jgi:hypothetical protein
MLKKSITYKDYNGEEVTEDFFFHLSRAELVELEVSHKDGLSESLQKIIATNDGAEIIREFKNIIMKAYGQKSPDGRRFIKNDQLRQEFESTEAYSVMFIELVTNSDAAAEFVNAVIPQDLSQLTLVPPSEPEPVAEIKIPVTDFEHVEAPRRLSRSEMMEMDADDLQSGFAAGRYVVDVEK